MTQESRRRAKQFAAEALARGEPAGWFEPFYQAAAGNSGEIPWAHEAANPLLCEWLARQPRGGAVEPAEAGAVAGRPAATALVVGCGLGNDAFELARLGWRVTAFDIAPTAIAWAQQRFSTAPETQTGRLQFTVADLLNPPAAWQGGFDFVFESYTLQALPAGVRAAAAAQVAGFVAPGGRLLVLCRGREAHEDPGGVPWPLTRAELQQLPGLQTVTWEEFFDREQPPQRRFRVEYRRGSEPQAAL